MSSSGGNGGSASGNGSTDDAAARRSNVRVQIIVAVIAAVAALCVPIVAFLLPQDGEKKPPAASCGLEDLSTDWTTPDSVPQNRQYYENGADPEVRVRVGPGDNPAIEVQGQIRLTPHTGQDLILAVSPDSTSRDSMGNRGSGRYYPHAAVEPDRSGCWNDVPHTLGYSGARGITEAYYLALVPHAQAAEFLARSGHPDGYSSSEWEALGPTTVLGFTVPTA